MRWVITGASRGLGLEFVKQLHARGEQVEAATHSVQPSDALATLISGSDGRVRFHACDVACDPSVRALAESIGDVEVDVLVNNAGVMGKMQSFEDLDLDDVRATFEVNALGPIRVTRALLPHLMRSKTRRVVHVTSGMGSISENTMGGAYGYRMSKAALNMANKSLSIDFRARGLTCVVINPGWVQTDMGGHGAPTPVSESIRLMLEQIDRLTPESTGHFVDYQGGTRAY